MTWNKFPEQDQLVATFTKDNIDQNNNLTIDVSSAVEEAVKNGQDAISFEVSMLNPNDANDVAIYFYSHKCSGKSGPWLEVSYDAQKEEQEQVFRNLRTKWKNYLVGENLDPKDSAVKIYVDTLNTTANTYWENMNRSDETSRRQLWDDVAIYEPDGTRNGPAQVNSNFERLLKLALAYETPGCDLYQNQDCLQEIIYGLEFMVDTYYNGSTSQHWGNWWEWEIGIPQNLCSTLLVLHEEIPQTSIEYLLTGVERYAPNSDSAGIPGSPNMTGANLLDKVLVVAQTGVLTGNESKMDHAYTAQKKAYRYVTSGDGFYEDGSFIQHGSLACTSDYGRKMYKCIADLFYILDDTQWEVKYSDGSEQVVYNGVFDAIEPLIYDGQFADSTAGRGVSRPTENTRTRAVGIMESLLLIGTTMDDREMKSSFESMAKYQIGVDETYFYQNATNITSILLAKEIMENDAIEARDDYSVHKTYAGMDRISHVRPSYMFNISMSSTRRSKFENFNDEGRRLWNIADGMTYLYTDELDQYTNDYWASIDPHRLPGTTVEHALSRPAFTSRTVTGKTPYSWAGGVTLGDYGTAGVQMKSLGNETKGNGNELTGADSKKSWFMFDDEIVAIGSSITSDTGNCVETIIDNRQIELDLSNTVTINGETPDLVDNSDSNDKHGTTIKNAQWANIQGSTENSTIGYYFPKEGTTIQALKERRDSNYNVQHYTDKEVSGSYATLWFDHGENPTDESYEYVTLPGKDAAETKAYAENPQIEVIENSDDAHAVRHKGLNMTGINFWKNEEKTAAGITSNKQASVMMRQTEDTLEISVSDPTQTNNGTIELTVPIPCSEVVSKDDTVSADMTLTSVKLTIDVAGAKGKSHSIVLKTSGIQNKNAIVSVSDPDMIYTEKGTEFEDLSLPETVSIQTSDNIQYDAQVVWSNAGYDGDSVGLYELSGLIVLPESVTNPEGLSAKIMVQVGDIYAKASQDTFVRDNSTTGNDHKSKPELEIKNDGKGYSRKVLVKIPLKDVPNDADKIYFMFEFAASPNSGFSDLAIYQTEDWDETTVTWDDFPERIGEKVASVTREDVEKDLCQKIDVTDLVKQAVEAGEEQISFELSIPEYSKDNYAAICSLEHKTGQVPTLYFETTPDPEVTVNKTALQALYEGNLHWRETDFTAESWKPFKDALTEAEQVLQDELATQDQVDEVETILREAVKGLVKSEAQNLSTAVLEYALELAKKADTAGVNKQVVEKFEAAVAHGQEILNKVESQDQTVTQSIREEQYEESGVLAVRSALAEACNVMENEQAEEKEVELAAENLQKAMDALVVKTDMKETTGTQANVADEKSVTTNDTAKSTVKSVKTGDMANMVLPLTVGLAALAAFVLSVSKKKER